MSFGDSVKNFMSTIVSPLRMAWNGIGNFFVPKDGIIMKGSVDDRILRIRVDFGTNKSPEEVSAIIAASDNLFHTAIGQEGLVFTGEEVQKMLDEATGSAYMEGHGAGAASARAEAGLEAPSDIASRDLNPEEEADSPKPTVPVGNAEE